MALDDACAIIPAARMSWAGQRFALAAERFTRCRHPSGNDPQLACRPSAGTEADFVGWLTRLFSAILRDEYDTGCYELLMPTRNPPKLLGSSYTGAVFSSSRRLPYGLG